MVMVVMVVVLKTIFSTSEALLLPNFCIGLYGSQERCHHSHYRSCAPPAVAVVMVMVMVMV
jgi:hypothetical protein